jgi:hypothetical protein
VPLLREPLEAADCLFDLASAAAAEVAALRAGTAAAAFRAVAPFVGVAEAGLPDRTLLPVAAARAAAPPAARASAFTSAPGALRAAGGRASFARASFADAAAVAFFVAGAALARAAGAFRATTFFFVVAMQGFPGERRPKKRPEASRRRAAHAIEAPRPLNRRPSAD